MHAEFWHERWRADRIGFHQAAVNENLLQYWHLINAPSMARVFVPLCGKSLDMLWLRARGHPVIGAELSDIALQAFCVENGIDARRRLVSKGDRYEATHLDLYRGDLFDLTPQAVGPIDAVFDRAALISWAPELRSRYVAHMSALTRPGTETLLITLEYPQTSFAGPPFSLGSDEVERLYAKNHLIQIIARCPVPDIEPRMRQKGIDQLSEVCYRITRNG